MIVDVGREMLELVQSFMAGRSTNFQFELPIQVCIAHQLGAMPESCYCSWMRLVGFIDDEDVRTVSLRCDHGVSDSADGDDWIVVPGTWASEPRLMSGASDDVLGVQEFIYEYCRTFMLNSFATIKPPQIYVDGAKQFHLEPDAWWARPPAPSA